MTTKFTYEFVKQYFEENGCILLEEVYKNTSTKMRYICSCSNESYITFHDFKYGHRCRRCSNSTTCHYSVDFVRKYFDEQGCTLLEERFINSSTKMKYMCKCGNISNTTFSLFQKGHRCKNCIKIKLENRKREMEVSYNDDFYRFIEVEGVSFRKLEIDAPLDFRREIDVCNEIKERKVCKICKTPRPLCSYFFTKDSVHSNDGLNDKCKICEGKKLRWGNDYKYELVKSGKKYCEKCDKIKPLTLLYFNKNSCSPDGYASYCKDCSSKSNTFITYVTCQEGHKICHSCLFELPDDEQHFFKRNDSSRISFCKACKGSEYGVKHLNRIYKMENKKICTKCKETLSLNCFHKSKNQKDGYQCVCKECYNFNGSKRRRQTYKSSYSHEDWLYTLKYFNNKCAYCEKNTQKLHKEHVVPFSKGGDFILENIIPSCHSCNSQKHARTLEEYYNSNLNKNFTEDKYMFILNFVNTHSSNKEAI